VYSEEFGLIGNGVLLVLYALLIARGLMIAANAATVFARLLAVAIALMFFTYAFVNMGMVSGSFRWSACRCRFSPMAARRCSRCSSAPASS